MNSEAVLTTFFEEEAAGEQETYSPPALVMEEYVPPPMPEPPSAPRPDAPVYDTRFFDPVGGSIPAKEPLMLLRASDPLALHFVEQYAQAATGENRERARVIVRSMQQWRQSHRSHNAQFE